MLSLTAFSQTRTISGRVTDAQDNQPLPAVTVTVTGTNVSAQTENDGTYSIQLTPNARSLTFTFVGYATREVALGSSDVVNVSLQVGGQSLEDVVVVGYGTQKRKEVTAAVATVKSEDFNAGGTRSPLDLIQGKVAGLTITRTRGNNPNEGAAIQLRGLTSLTGDLRPLIVVDGIPGGNLDLLQQDDIESFDVLKDGAAAAIYGTRANGGVILITTKKGKSGEPVFGYNSYVQKEFIAKRPDVLSADEFLKLTGATDLGGRDNVYDMLIDKNNISHYHNLSASGGTAKSNYRASMFFNDAKGIAIRNTRKQYGGRLNINQRGFNDKLALQVNLAQNFSKADRLGGSTGDFEQSIQRDPTAPVYRPDGTFWETENFNNYNPIARLTKELNERDQTTFSGDAKLTLEVLKDLKISAFGALQRNTWNDREYRMKDSRSSVRDYNGGGYGAKSNFLEYDRIFESTIDYNLKFNNDHTIGAIAGYSYQYHAEEAFNVNNNGFLTDAFQDWNLGNGSAIRNVALRAPGIGSSKQDNTLIAFFGRVNYAYKGKYLLQGILRREGSSRFGANHKWGNFPAASIGWFVTEEDFMKDISFLSSLKLRAGYGVTGNQGIPNYQSLVTLGTGGFYLQNGLWLQTLGPARNPNPDLRWEKKKELNIGIDFGLFQNRITGSLDIYNRTTEDLLYNYNAQQPPFTLSTLFTNVGSISNNGVELQLSATPVRSKDFSWSIDFTGSYNTNKLKSLSNELYKIDRIEFGGLPSPGNLGNAIRMFEGGPVGDFYGKRFAGFSETGEWQFYKADGSIGKTNQMTNEDLTVIGNSVPKYYASLSNTLRYKGFDLTLFFRGKFKFDILNTQDMYFANINWKPNNMLRSVLDKHAQVKQSPQYSDYYLESGSFVKLDNITLGYNFRMHNNYIKSLRLYATGRNVLTFTKYSGLDPELQDTGFTTNIDDRGFYPRTLSLAFGLNVGF